MSSAHRIRPGVIFQLTRDLANLPESTKLRNIEWGILLAITGRHSVAQIGAHFELSAAERDHAFHRILSEGLIVEREVNFTEYLLAAATVGDDEPKTLASFLRSGAAFGPNPARPSKPPAIQGKGVPSQVAVVSAPEPGSQPLAPPLHPTPKKPIFDPPPPPASVPLRTSSLQNDSTTPSGTNPPAASRGQKPVHRSSADSVPLLPPPNSATALLDPLEALNQPADEATTRAIPTASLAAMNFEPLPPAEGFQVVPKTDSQASNPLLPDSQQKRRLSVKAVMRFILDRATDINSGQLDVYRVFIRVNTKLLKRNGIQTLRFQEDQLISDPELQEAIIASVKKTLNLQCPQTVFV